MSEEKDTTEVKATAEEKTIPEIVEVF